MNTFQETLGQILRPQFDALTQSPISAILIEYSGKVERTEALRACPGVSNTAALPRGAYGPAFASPIDWVWREHELDCDDDNVLRSLAEQAGNCIGPWAECFGASRNTIAGVDSLAKWLYLLFELAWSKKQRFLMVARKRYIESGRIPRRTADRYWAYARAWLHQRLSHDGSSSQE